MKKIIAIISSLVAVFLFVTVVKADKPATTGFDVNGYNNTARIFNGTTLSWCVGKFGLTAEQCMDNPGFESYDGYWDDRIVMKWNAQWDSCNVAKGIGVDACLGAWTSNEWNGMNGGSGEVWHYKIIWVGPDADESDYWLPGGYSIWSNYEVIMDQGVSNGVHTWNFKAVPNGYGLHP